MTKFFWVFCGKNNAIAGGMAVYKGKYNTLIEATQVLRRLLYREETDWGEVVAVSADGELEVLYAASRQRHTNKIVESVYSEHMQPIIIQSVNMYRDGGTRKISIGDTPNGWHRVVYQDRRIGTTTYNTFWNKHPNEKDAQQITDVQFVMRLEAALLDYDNK